MANVVVVNKVQPFVILEHYEHCTLIGNTTVEVDTSALTLLNEMCLCHGSSVKGRIDAFKHYTNAKQKPAILISEITLQMYFPLQSSSHHENIWLAYNQIVSYHRKDVDHTEILFDSGFTYIVPFSYRVIQAQMNRCTEFTIKLRESRK